MDYPEAFSSTTRKARKVHTCCECNTTIGIGEKYQYSSGIWEGTPDNFKQCLNCNNIMENVSSYVTYDDFGNDPPYFCELREWFMGFECIDFTGEEFLKGMSETVNIQIKDLNKLLKVEI